MPIGLNDEKTVGTVISGTSNTVPNGFLLCNGSQVSRTVYSRLFSVIGTTYGIGDGSTTFTLPDFVGAVPRGAGTSSGYTQNVTVTLGSKDNDAIQDHTHTINAIYQPNGTVAGIGSSGNLGNTIQQSFTSTNHSGTTANETRMKNVGVNFFIKF